MFLGKAFLNFRQWLNTYGEKIDYRNYDPSIFKYRDSFETVRVLIQFIKPKYLCDIGAYTGKWSFVMHQMNPGLEHVVLFEPQRKFREELRALPLGNVQKVIYECGLGDEEKSLTIKGGTSSASILDVAPAQTQFFPDSVKQDEEKIGIKVLDDIYSRDKLPYPDVIKIDVQGYELNVLKGARQVLSKAKYLVIELSFREFYAGQPPLSEVLQFLEMNDFMMVSHGYELRSSKSPLEILQMDGIFVNTKLVKGFHEL